MQPATKKELVFIPGKNWKLSLAELAAFLEARNRKFDINEFSREFFTMNVDAGTEDLCIDGFGGIIKIGNVKGTFQTELLERFFVKNDKPAKAEIKNCIIASGVDSEILGKSSGKLLFGVSVYCADRSLRGVSSRIQRFVGSAIKDEIKAQGGRSDFMGFSGNRELSPVDACGGFEEAAD